MCSVHFGLIGFFLFAIGLWGLHPSVSTGISGITTYQQCYTVVCKNQLIHRLYMTKSFWLMKEPSLFEPISPFPGDEKVWRMTWEADVLEPNSYCHGDS